MQKARATDSSSLCRFEIGLAQVSPITDRIRPVAYDPMSTE